MDIVKFDEKLCTVKGGVPRMVEPQSAIRSLEYRADFNAGGEGMYPTANIFSQGVESIPSFASAKAARKLQAGDFVTKNVALDALVPTQDEVIAAKVEEDNDEEKPLDVIELDGKQLLWDGHHRAAAAILHDVTELPANVYSIN